MVIAADLRQSKLPPPPSIHTHIQSFIVYVLPYTSGSSQLLLSCSCTLHSPTVSIIKLQLKLLCVCLIFMRCVDLCTLVKISINDNSNYLSVLCTFVCTYNKIITIMLHPEIFNHGSIQQQETRALTQVLNKQPECLNLF